MDPIYSDDTHTLSIDTHFSRVLAQPYRFGCFALILTFGANIFLTVT